MAFRYLRKLLRELGEVMSDHAREDLCEGLRAMGIDTRMEERGQREENSGVWSYGLIDIAEGPIRWVNVDDTGGQERANNIAIYGVPDSRYLPHVQIRSVRVKTFLRRAIDVRWKGNDLGLGIAQRLSNDEAIRGAIMATGDEVTVVAAPDHGCWLIRRKTAVTPSLEQWGCYRAIAESLLRAPLQAGETQLYRSYPTNSPLMPR